MTAPFRLFGAELSPYAVKVRAYLKYKGLDFVWTSRSNANQGEFAKYAKLPLAPVLVDADENVLQDSTPMIEALEAQYPEPSILPDSAGLRFLAALFEDYADEWLNKAMFHYRWSNETDRESAARRTLDMLFEGAEAPEGLEASIAERMAARLHYVGSSAESAPVIESSFKRLLSGLEALLAANGPYLFGGRPSAADFGLYGQFAQLFSDPTPGAILRAEAPALTRWIERMAAPRDEGAFASLESLSESLKPLLSAEIAGAYLPWMAANAEAVADDAALVRVEIDGATFAQKPQRYAAKALAELRRKYGATGPDEALAALMEAVGADEYLASQEIGDMSDSDESDSDSEGDDGEN